eukprot:SAG11_NODE_5370_length_1580_cov_17.934504_2_plen_159_part_00
MRAIVWRQLAQATNDPSAGAQAEADGRAAARRRAARQARSGPTADQQPAPAGAPLSLLPAALHRARATPPRARGGAPPARRRPAQVDPNAADHATGETALHAACAFGAARGAGGQAERLKRDDLVEFAPDAHGQVPTLRSLGVWASARASLLQTLRRP